MTSVKTSSRAAAAETIDTLLLGRSDAMEAVRALVRRVAVRDASVLVTGPSGSGKERVARAIHATSDRRNGPFVAINCGAIPRDLLESQLFGHEKGSFTGAYAQQIGRFEEAHGGTLFLDEIGDMPHDMQVKLLRVLEERVVQRVGGRASIPVDVRIVSATHRDLPEAIITGSFREDLFYRLAVFPIELPSLAERSADIPMLLEHFLASAGERRVAIRFAQDVIACLATHEWPGNLRELRNLAERAAILHPGETLRATDIDRLLRRKPLTDAIALGALAAAPLSITPDPALLGGGQIDLREIIADLEGRYIRAALEKSGGVVAEAARLLGLRRTTLIEKRRRYRV